MAIKLLWQEPSVAEREWITELFSPFIDGEVVDGERRMVLDDCILIDSYLHYRSEKYYEQFRGRNAWLFHLSDETYEGGYRVYRHFRGVFRNYWSDIFPPQFVMQLPLGYTAGINRQGRKAKASERNYLWSFLGQAQRGSRSEMMRALCGVEPKFTHVTDSGFGVEPVGRAGYERVLRDSVFVPSPMGNVNLDSFRVYEALELGAIPVLERRATLNYFAGLLGPHPLPVFANWGEAANYIAKMKTDQARLDELQSRCLMWWASYKDTLRERIGNFMSVQHDGEESRSLSWRYSIPGWQGVELLRHHSLAAVARRVALQVNRLARQKRFRRTTGA